MADCKKVPTLYLKKDGNTVTFKVRVQPRSSQNRVVGLMEDALKIKLTAPPVDGAANAMCLRFFADLLKCSKSAIDIVGGQTAREKKIRLSLPHRSDIDVAIRRLDKLIDSAKGKA